ncbi:hypothetical protein ACHAQA_007565 [Verticillium albo-atrum]
MERPPGERRDSHDGDDGEASKSSTGPSTTQSNSTPSAPSSSGPPSAGPSASTPAQQQAHNPLAKRRRGLGIVTPNACTECRKKRAKCDGQKPCSRCQGQPEIECVYEIPVRQSKENLRTEIEQLRYRQRSSDQVFAALVRPDAWEEVLKRLRSGQSVEAISDWVGVALPPGSSVPAFGRSTGEPPGFSRISLAPISTLGLGRIGSSAKSPVTGQPSGLRQEVDPNSPWNFSSYSQSTRSNSQSHPDSMNWSTDGNNQPPQNRVGFWGDALDTDQVETSVASYRGLDQVLAPLEAPKMKTPASTWSNITADIILVQHLLALYFCWEYPTFASLSKEHFLKDFQDGRPRYCSPILVNALLALGCRFSTKPSTRAVPDDPYTSGDHFFKESQRLFYQEEDHHTLTTIQALGIMSIREASCGRDSESWYYAGQSIRLAIEMGLHQVDGDGDADEVAVQAATFWGAFGLDHAWSLATGSLPQCSCYPHLPPKPAIIDDIEASLWIPYTDDGAPLQRSAEQPSNVRSVYKCFCELSELVHQSLYVLYSPGRPLTSRDLLSLYTQYLNWYDRIPEVLRLGHNFTPAVLFTHMYYHFAILLLFRPLIKLKIIGSKIAPRDVCSQAADAIQGLLRSHSQLYTLRRTPSFVPYFVLTSAIMHLAISAPVNQVSGDKGGLLNPSEEAKESVDAHVAQAVKQGVEDLKEMSPCHHFAEQALNILRYLAHKWKIEVDMGGEDVPLEEYARCARPFTSSLNFFAPNVREEDFVCAWGSGDTNGEGNNAPPPPQGGGGGGGGAAQKDEGRGETTAEKAYARAAMSAAAENHLFWPFPMQDGPIKANLSKPRPSYSSSIGNALSLPPRWLHKYEEFITKNASQVSQIESGLRSLTYVIPGRFRDAEIASETVHSSVQLLSLYHDGLLARALARLPITKIPSPHNRYTQFWTQRNAMYRRVAMVLQMVTYTQLLWEMAAKRKGGNRGRWRVVVLLEAIKALCRLLLLRITRSRPLVTPVLPEREPVPEDPEEEAAAASELQQLIGGGSGPAEEEEVDDGVKAHEKEWAMPRTGMSLPSLPRPGDISGYLLGKVLTSDDIKPAPKLLNQTQGPAQAAEVLHILAPLVYAIALARSKDKRSWTPWLVGLSVEYAARQLRDRGFRTTPLEREEWNKRGWAMGWWAMRGAFYEKVTKGVVGGVRSRMPSIVGGILEDYEYLWENYYFSTSA